MNAPTVTQLLGSAPATALPGTWKLARGRALTLRPTTDGVLRIAHGRVWATVEGPHGRTPDDSGEGSMAVRAEPSESYDPVAAGTSTNDTDDGEADGGTGVGSATWAP